MKDIEPLERIGFCQGCKQHDQKLYRVSESYYRCGKCSMTENSKPFTTADIKYEDLIIEARCDACPTIETGRRGQLKENGWNLLPKEQFCPKCNTE